MATKKERLLEKYLEKKRKQRNRDELYAQIAALKRPEEGTGCRGGSGLEDTGEVEESSCDVGDSLEPASEDLPRGTGHEESSSTTGEVMSAECGAVEDLDGEETVDMYWWDLHAKNVDRKSGVTFGSSVGSETPSCDGIVQGFAQEDKCAWSVEDERKDAPREYETEALENRRKDIEEYRKTLPIYYEKAEIVYAVRTSAVVFVTGAPGCGKTTQIPQFLYEGGLAAGKMIGVTQPRRISATSISSRINEEMNENLCGYKIKYESTVTSETRIKVMTDGVLIKEIQDDFLLSRYSVIIVDEVHERNTNIDLLISIIPRIMKVRRARGDDLKLVLMSATGDADEFKAFLGDVTVFVCPEKRFRVSTFYEEKTEADYLDAAYERVKKIVLSSSGARKRRRVREGRSDIIGSEVLNDKSASILVFLTSKQEIYQLKSRLEDSGMDITVLPLHSSLSKSEQKLVFDKMPNRKVILATNIAETSITIPDVVFVVDSGKVKNRLVDSEGVTKYSIDFITKSNAIQRTGRAGRTGPGVCYRLYSGEAYERFYESMKPQILREPLDGVVLNLLSLGIRDIYSFPFLSKPGTTSINNAIARLQGLGAVDKDLKLTGTGKKMSRYPVEPRLARLLCAQGLDDISTEIIVLVSLISSGAEVRRNHSNKRYFEGSKSDFLVQLSIYSDFLKSKSRKAFCKEMGMSYTTAVEAMKMTGYLMNISGGTADRNVSLDLSPDTCLKIRNIIYRGFVDHLAIPSSGSHFFRTEEVLASRDSISVCNGDFVVFESLVSSKGKLYMKNITAVEEAWF
ncbi:PRE-mRNA SPLICING FACTOR [Encephalitozoon cuniculi GB-M1]|uniref:RNA helicase n=1 Tax=Encephalitozoon cuniculi (strain GB-M1) TaxID=284813 RepID=Q8SR50_ENCCU|nr:uncharacterized protein ECU10_0680 [Encephalitozoon cuniculi GB-M1]CAD25787.1 PRE-mRNA SPLICING FACTOR [Encephalitozoon cuniculi GB-M1]